MSSRDSLKLSNPQTRGWGSFANARTSIPSGMLCASFLSAALHPRTPDPLRIEANAGLAFIRLADDALRRDRVSDVRDAAAKEAVSLVENMRQRRALRAGVLAVRTASNRRQTWRSNVATAMLHYADALRADGRYDLAEDVYDVVMAHFAEEWPVLMAGLVGKGWSRRRDNDLEGAETVYLELLRIAERTRSTSMILDAKLGLASITGGRGYLGAMREVVEDVRESANKCGDSRIEGRAYAYLAWAAGGMERHGEAIQHCNAALACDLSDIDRTRTWINMANAFRSIGRQDTASEIARLLVATPGEVEHRLAGASLLYDISIDRRDMEAIAFCRACLTGAKRSPEMTAELIEHRAREQAVMHHDFPGAIEELERAVAFTREHELMTIVSRLAKALAALRAGNMPETFNSPVQRPPTDAEPEITSIAQSIHDRYSASVAVA